jgi:hypothetical protein
MVEPAKALAAAADRRVQEVSEEARTVAVAPGLSEALVLVAKAVAVRFLAVAAGAADTSEVEVAVQTPTLAAPMLEAEAEAPPLPIRPWFQTLFTRREFGLVLAR